jgi:uncharacterized protein (DUF2126 family)
MHVETYCGREIYPVKTYGVMEVYERKGYRSMGCPKYVVFHQNGRALEEFRLRRKALRWARTNQNG